MTVTPDQPRRELHKVLERIARRLCAVHYKCLPTDRDCDVWWREFLPSAHAAYREIIAIDEER